MTPLQVRVLNDVLGVVATCGCVKRKCTILGSPSLFLPLILCSMCSSTPSLPQTAAIVLLGVVGVGVPLYLFEQGRLGYERVRATTIASGVECTRKHSLL